MVTALDVDLKYQNLRLSSFHSSFVALRKPLNLVTPQRCLEDEIQRCMADPEEFLVQTEWMLEFWTWESLGR